MKYDDLTIDSLVLNLEIAKVQSQLIAFRDEFLPVILKHPLLKVMPEETPEVVKEYCVRTSSILSKWQRATTEISDALPIVGGEDPLNPNDFEQFIYHPATPDLVVTERGLLWRISLFTPTNWESEWHWPRCLEKQDTADSREQYFTENLPQIKQWIMDLPLTQTKPYNLTTLMNALCLNLPSIVDSDPTFVKQALTPQTWRSIIEEHKALSEEERLDSLDSIDHGHFCHAINNALLHVIAALGNNHFMSIREYLDHPCLYGAYTGLMPHYLFALLFQKVSILQKMKYAVIS